MTLLDDLVGAAAWPALAAVHGEPVLYRPFGGVPRTITAVVTRNPLQPIVGIPNARAIAHKLVIRFENHPVRGVDSSQLNTGKDLVDVAVIKGGAVSTLRLSERLSDRGGMLKVGVV